MAAYYGAERGTSLCKGVLENLYWRSEADSMVRKQHDTLHVFAGSFPSRDDACLHSEPQWEPEPDDSASDEEYAAWEGRNPAWELRDDLGVGLDSDFIETIDGDERYDYLAGYLVDDSDLDAVRTAAGISSILVLIFADALHDRKAELKSTTRLIYCGAFDFGRS